MSFIKQGQKEVQSSLQETHLKYNNPERLKIKGKNMYHAKINQGKIWVDILTAKQTLRQEFILEIKKAIS